MVVLDEIRVMPASSYFSPLANGHSLLSGSEYAQMLVPVSGLPFPIVEPHPNAAPDIGKVLFPVAGAKISPSVVGPALVDVIDFLWKGSCHPKES